MYSLHKDEPFHVYSFLRKSSFDNIFSKFGIGLWQIDADSEASLKLESTKCDAGQFMN